MHVHVKNHNHTSEINREITHFEPIQHGQICKGSDYFPGQIISQMAHFLRNFAMVILHKMQPNSSQNIFNAITILSF